MGKRTRVVAMIGAGLMAAVAPVLALQAPAGAAQTNADAHAGLTFVDGSGLTVTCTDFLNANHNTDDPKNPYVMYGLSAQQSGGDSGLADCDNEVDAFVTITYKDTHGQAQSSSFQSGLGQQVFIGGAASAVQVKAAIHLYNCNSTLSASCDLTVAVAPK
jgi:hypothetical protein